jgi:hypothetical protein
MNVFEVMVRVLTPPLHLAFSVVAAGILILFFSVLAQELARWVLRKRLSRRQSGIAGVAITFSILLVLWLGMSSVFR